MDDDAFVSLFALSCCAMSKIVSLFRCCYINYCDLSSFLKDCAVVM